MQLVICLCWPDPSQTGNLHSAATDEKYAGRRV